MSRRDTGVLDASLGGVKHIVLATGAGVVMLLLTSCGGDGTSKAVDPGSGEPATGAADAGTVPAAAPLPPRPGPHPETTGAVPHTQLSVTPVPEVDEELRRRAFALLGVEDRPTIVSLPGARGLWLDDSLPLARPDVILRGREFSHVHPDGSLHTPLSVERALEAAEAGWAELHPWVDRDGFWDGLVMLYTPQSLDELAVTMRLIVESYNFVTGRNIDPADLE